MSCSTGCSPSALPRADSTSVEAVAVLVRAPDDFPVVIDDAVPAGTALEVLVALHGHIRTRCRPSRAAERAGRCAVSGSTAVPPDRPPTAYPWRSASPTAPSFPCWRPSTTFQPIGSWIAGPTRRFHPGADPEDVLLTPDGLNLTPVASGIAVHVDPLPEGMLTLLSRIPAEPGTLALVPDGRPGRRDGGDPPAAASRGF